MLAKVWEKWKFFSVWCGFYVEIKQSVSRNNRFVLNNVGDDFGANWSNLNVTFLRYYGNPDFGQFCFVCNANRSLLDLWICHGKCGGQVASMKDCVCWSTIRLAFILSHLNCASSMFKFVKLRLVSCCRLLIVTGN